MGGDVKEEMYLPDAVPEFGELSEEDEEEMVEDEVVPRRTRSARPESRTRSRSRSRESTSRTGDKSVIEKFGIFAAYCLVKDCERHERGFNNERAARDHLRVKHGLGKEEIQKLEEENEMIGGVHRDGFGVVVKRRQGWRGADEGLRKERKSRERAGRRAVGRGTVEDESEEEATGDSLKNEYF
ncbi:hypothetical protein V491_07972 [Pseudogymnoascus sp. VKM F-3775]|nr:hypothetical protein V491_07972 [Pseudogymnoascus sp. VKM F-3775]